MMGKTLITGGFGFLGKHIYRELLAQNREVSGAGSEYDLSLYYRCVDLFTQHRPELIIHCAGYNGGIEFNNKFPADIFYLNTIMGLNVLEASRVVVPQAKVVSIVASCAYDGLSSFLQPQAFLNGRPHSSVAGHGFAKRNLQIASDLYRRQYGMEAVCVCPTTLYGPGDSFDPERTKVMGALIRKFVDAVDDHANEVTLWGTGGSYRHFLYVKDAAKLIIDAANWYKNSRVPLNLAPPSNQANLPIRKLAEKIAQLVGYTGKICWDKTKPDGQMGKMLDCTLLVNKLPNFQFTSLDDGIRETVKFYREQVKCCSSS